MGIVEDFLKKGILVSPEVAAKIRLEEIDELLGKLDGKTAVLTEELYSLYRTSGPKVITEYKKEEETKRINNFVDFYNNRFEFLRGVLAEKVDQEKITSLNKLSFGEATVIGMVREVREGGFMLEDQTGSVFCRSENIVMEDEVVAARGKFDRGLLQVEKLFYPDVPLSRKVNVTENDFHTLFTCRLTSRASRKYSHVDYIFTFDLEESASEGVKWLITKKGVVQRGATRLMLNLPAMVEIEGLKVLFFQYDEMDELKKKFGTEDEKKLVTELIKRRHMLPFLYKSGDPYLLREIPDIIFFTGGKESFFLNYKGVSIISVLGEDGFVVNLKTREFQKVEL